MSALQVSLWLEKLYLTEEVSAQKVKASGEDKSSETMDLWEKRQLKALRKLKGTLRSTLQSLQLHFAIKADMADEDASDREDKSGNQNSQTCEYDTSFNTFFEKVLIEPFGDRLTQELTELANELDLPDHLLSSLQKRGPRSQ